jgi:hypothetical protein
VQEGKQIFVNGTQLAVAGKLLKVARLSHEWFQFLDNPSAMVETVKGPPPVADILTFMTEAHNKPGEYPFYKEAAGTAVMKVPPFDQWWKGLDFKVRNKIRKAQKSGVELRLIQLDDAFAAGVERIYNECPIRQGRKFLHYGKTVARIKQDLSSFPECTCFVGAYHGDELIGFMKLYQGNNILRTVHIIAKLSHRDKPVQDALIAKAVEICNERKIGFLHYGNWSNRGLGDFKIKHGFERMDLVRYFVPLTLRGRMALRLKLHHRMRDYLPEKWILRLIALRTNWNTFRHRAPKKAGGAKLNTDAVA